MNKKDVSQAKDSDLSSALPALKRSAEAARSIAIQTGTDLIIADGGKLVRIPAADLVSKNPQTTDDK